MLDFSSVIGTGTTGKTNNNNSTKVGKGMLDFSSVTGNSSANNDDDDIYSKYYDVLKSYETDLNKMGKYYSNDNREISKGVNILNKQNSNNKASEIDSYLNELSNMGYGAGNEVYDYFSSFKQDYQNYAAGIAQENDAYRTWEKENNSSGASSGNPYDALFKDVTDKNSAQAAKDKYQQLYDNATTWEEKYAYEDTLKYLDDKYYSYLSPAEIQIMLDEKGKYLDDAKQKRIDSQMNYSDLLTTYDPTTDMLYDENGVNESSKILNSAKSELNGLKAQEKVLQTEYNTLSNRLADANAKKISDAENGTELGMGMANWEEAYRKAISDREVEYGEDGLEVGGDASAKELEKQMRKTLIAAGYSETEAADWIEATERRINKEVNSAKIEGYYDNALGSDFWKGAGLTAARTGANLAGGFAAAGEAIDQLFSKSNYTDYDIYDTNFLLSNYANQTSQGIMDTHKYQFDENGKLLYDENGKPLEVENNKWEWNLPFFSETDIFDTMYGILTSSADSMLAAAVGGFAGSAVVGGITIGLQAGTQELLRLAEQGASKGQSLAGGIVAGAFESLFETLSISQFNALAETGVAFTKNMTKEQVKAACKEVAKDFAKTFITNASEELNTELANVLFDAYVNGGFSDYERLIREYHTKHPNEMGEEADKAAKDYALHELTMRVIEAGATGGLQGLLMGAVGVGTGSVKESYYQNKFYAAYNNYGEQIRSEAEKLAAEKGWNKSDIDKYVNEVIAKGDFSSYDIKEGKTAKLVSDTLAADENSKTANKYNEKISEGKGLNAGQINKLYNENQKAYSKADQAKIESAVTERLTALGESGDVAYLSEAITKQTMGKRLNADEKYTIENSKYAQRVINELNPDNIVNGQYASEWAENLGTKVINPGAYNKSKIEAAITAMEESSKSNKLAPQRADIERTGIPSIDAVVRQQAVDSSSFVSEAQVKAVLNDSAAMEYLGINLSGMSNAQKKSAVKAALYELANKNAPKAVNHSNTPASVSEVANKYGKMSNAVVSVYNLNAVENIDAFAREFDAAYKLGQQHGNISELELKTLNDTQKRLAYAFGKAETDAKILVGKEALKASQKDNKSKYELKKKGKLTSNISALEINKIFTSKTNQLSAVKMLRNLAAATGFNIEIYDSNLVGAQGEFDSATNTLRIDIQAGINKQMDVGELARYTMLRTFCHEFTHAGEKWAPQEYEILRAAVIETYSQNENFDFEKAVDEQISNNEASWIQDRKEYYMEYEGLSEENALIKAEAWVENNGWDYGSREVIAEAMVDVLPESKFLENLYKKSPSVGQKLMDALSRFIEKVKNYWNEIVRNDAPEANALKYEMDGTIKYFSDIINKWDAMAEKAVENKRLAAEKYQQYEELHNPATVNARNITKEGLASVTDSNGVNMFQLRTMRQDADAYMQDLRDAGLVGEGKLMSEAELNELYNTINRTMDYVEKNIEAIERSETFREMDGENRPFLPYKDNSDPHYKKALDFSTLCRKRLLTQAITEKLQKALGRAVTPVEQVHIRNEIKKLKEEGKRLDVACALCYVEAARLKSPKVINDFLNHKTESLQNYFSLKNSTFKNEVYAKKQGDWKEAKGLPRNATKDQIKAAGYSVNEFNKFSLDIRKGYWSWLEKADPKEFAFEKNIIDIANSMDNSEYLSANSLAKMRGDEQLSILYDAFISKVRMATRSKAQETDVPYVRGDINMVGDAIIEQMNEESGFRHQSWSDFQAMHILDTMAAVIELSIKNAKVHTYTKVTDMVRFLGETGMMINMSLIPAGETGYDTDGLLMFDPSEGMNYEEMLKLRDKYADTAGNIAIGISDEHILSLLNSPDIDYIIPYHVSGLNADMRRRMGIKKWKDYSHYQNEKGSDWEKKAPRLKEWFSETEATSYANAYDYMVEASKKYLQLCHERGLTPKFSQFLNKNSDGSYSLREDAKNYWKLLIDRKMVNHITNSIIVQKAVKPTFNADTTLDILDNEVNSQAAIDAREAEKYIVNKMLTEPGTFTKQELEQARILRDAAIRMVIEDSGVKQNQTRIKNTEAVSEDAKAELSALPENVVGLNINDSTQAFTQQIISGEKTIETRPVYMPKLLGQRIAITQSGIGGSMKVVAFADVTDIKKYTPENFQDDYDKHLVSPGSQFDLTEGVKYGYVLDNVVPVTPFAVTPFQNTGNIANPYSLDTMSMAPVQRMARPLNKRVKGDDLYYAESLIEDIQSVGGYVDENGIVTVFHRTSNENARKIYDSGKMYAKEDGLFFSTKELGQNEGYGDTVVELHIPVEKLVLDDIFDDEAHLRMPLRDGAREAFISGYLVIPDNKVYVHSKNSALSAKKDNISRILAEHIPDISGMDIVAKLTGRELNDPNKSTIEQINEYFNSINNHAYREGLGDVILGNYGAKSMMTSEHQPSRIKNVVAVAAKDLIESGKEIQREKNWKGRGYDSYTYAGPVEVAGKKVYACAVVHKKNNSNQFYLDAVVDEEGNYLYINEGTAVTSEIGITANNGVTGGQLTVPTGIIVNQETDFVKQNQQRTKTLSDRDVLSQASQTIDRTQLTAEQAKALDTFDKYLAEDMQLREQRNEQNKLIKQYREENNRNELVKAENRRDVLSSKISRVESKMLAFENTAVAKQLLKASRVIVETQQDLETSQRLEEYYTKKLNRAAQNSDYDEKRIANLNKKLSEVRKDRDAKIAELRKVKNDKISDIIKNKNQRIDEAIREKKNILNEYKAEQRENMTAREIRNHIYAMAEDFRTMVTKPGKTVTRHAPVSLVSAIAGFCDIFDENRYMRLNKNTETLEQRKSDYEKGKPWNKDVDAEALKIKNREEQLARQNAALDMLKLKYDALMNDELYNSYYDEHIAGMLANAKSLLTQKDLFEMTSKELYGIDNLMRALRKTVVDANKAVAMKKGQEISEVASKLAAQIDKAAPKKNNLGRTAQRYAMWQMRPDTFFSYITGFAKDSVGEDVQEMFVDGTERMLGMQREFYHMMSKLTESKNKAVQTELKNLMNNQTKNLVDWGLTDRNGEKVETTRGMMLQAYMLLLQEDSFNSLVYGGFKIPRMEAYYKGNMSEAYSGADENSLVSAGVYGDVYVLQDELNGIKDRQIEIEEKLKEQGITDAEKQQLNAENLQLSQRADDLNTQIADIVSGAEARLYKMRQEIENKLTQTEKDVLSTARQWYDYSGEKLDEVFIDLYGYKPIRPKNYTTIHRSLDTVQTDIRSVDMATNLENFGSTKERVKSKDPILMTDIFNELNGNVQRMSKYYGYVEAQKDFNRIWNFKTPGTQSSIKAKIASKFLDGDNAVMPSGSQYIENYVKNISGANADREGSSPFHALYSGLAGANLALNPRVALSQWASIPTAAAEVGWGNMAKGFAKGFTDMFSTEAKRQLAEDSVWYWQRYRGEGGITEIGDMMGANGAWAKLSKTKAGKAFLNWCQMMDTMATASMWSMAEEQARQNGFKKGTAEFKAETEKVFRDIIRRTQPNYTTTERSDLLRDKRDSMKLLTMYKTQSNQNLNILVEATGKFRKMKQDFKAGANGVTKADVTAATKNLANAYTAVILGGSLTFALLRSIVNIAFGKIRDDDDEFTAEALAESILKDTVSSVAGMFSVGSQIYDFILPLVSGDNYYGLSDSAFGAASDLLEQTNKLIQKAQDEDKAIEWSDVNKEIRSICNIIGVPWRNGENILKAAKMWYEDAAAGTFGTFEAGAERTKSDEVQRFLNGYLAGDEEKIGRATAGYLVLVGNDEKKFRSAVATAAKKSCKKGELTTEQYEDILKNYLGYEDDDVTKKMQTINAELKLGSIDSDNWTEVFNTDKSAEDIDVIVAQYGGNYKTGYSAYRAIGYEPKAAYDAAQALDVDKTGSISQYEVYTAGEKLSKDKAEKLWNAMGYEKKYEDYKPGKADEYKMEAKTNASISSYNADNWKEALTDSSLSNSDKDTLALAYGGAYLQSSYKALRDENYSPLAAYNMLTAIDTDGNSNISQKEVRAYITSQNMSKEKAQETWEIFKAAYGWKKNY